MSEILQRPSGVWQTADGLFGTTILTNPARQLLSHYLHYLLQ